MIQPPLHRCTALHLHSPGVIPTPQVLQMEFQHPAPVLDCSFPAYGFKRFLGLAFRNHSGHTIVVEQAFIIQPMWRKGIGKEVTFNAQAEAQQSLESIAQPFPQQQELG